MHTPQDYINKNYLNIELTSRFKNAVMNWLLQIKLNPLVIPRMKAYRFYVQKNQFNNDFWND